jgi:poly-gamma-glutamate biosynthesis protein PgsC/CapC
VHEYLFRPEVARVALVIGVVVSVLFYERLQLTTGGAIVPAYVALFLIQPLYVATTIAIALATYLLVNRVLVRRWILYGRRRFEVEVLIGLALVAITVSVGELLGLREPVFLGLTGIGMVIPGILAHDMGRQNPRRTLVALAATAAIVAAAVYVFGSLVEISPLRETPMPLVGDETGYPIDLLLAGAIASVLAGMVIYAVLGLRSGGYVSAAYLGLLVVRPWDLVYTVVVALVVWWVVTSLVMPHVLIFGRRKLSSMIMVSAILAWPAAELLGRVSYGVFQPWKGFVLMSLMIPALVANDFERQGVEKTFWGATIATGFVFGSMNLFSAALVAAGVI